MYSTVSGTAFSWKVMRFWCCIAVQIERGVGREVNSGGLYMLALTVVTVSVGCASLPTASTSNSVFPYFCTHVYKPGHGSIAQAVLG